jgi:hypothetical protein
MPQSNKRTFSLSSPHPVDLQSHCSAMLGSLPLRLCQAPSPCQSHTPPGSPPLRPHWAPALHRIHATLRSSPFDPPALRPYCAPAPCGTTRTTLHWDPYPLGPAKSLTHQFPAPGAEPGPALQAYQVTAPPDFHSDHHH